ncbi:hypothetical protein BGZ99_010140 [Dissophora globulifera]|uniref:Uncharacterized protein n=1 Tax=Dissophora globulifera TaxID=979702 RepID=A0A9P6RQC1_9FUNG|nr:hypothetical protein BGZ99_010140 [Dissophora globulifera]
MEESSQRQSSELNKTKIAYGIMSVSTIILDDKIVWSDKQIGAVVELVMDGWIESDSALRSRVCGLLEATFTASQLLRSLGALTTARFLQSPQVGADLCLAVLRQLSHTPQKTEPPMDQEPTDRGIKDWSLMLWYCEQLRIPSLFASSSSIQDSETDHAAANAFVKKVPAFLEAIGHILRLQLIDNTYTLHRVIIACAAFTNSKDLWNRLDPSSSKASLTLSQENLKLIYTTTPWSISPDSVNSSSSSSSTTATTFLDKRVLIKIPGSFSDHVIQILEKELRPCFTHTKAEKVASRAQATIEHHQERLRQTPLVQMLDGPRTSGSDDENDDEDGVSLSDGIVTTRKSNAELIRVHQPQKLLQPNQKPIPSQRILIAPVTDTPNDEEEVWMATDDVTSMTATTAAVDISSQPKRWNSNFLESVPVAEWCAQQTIQDPSRIHEVFMVLVGPILALTEALQPRYRIRGLDVLTRFLLQYYDVDGQTSGIQQQYQQQHPVPSSKKKPSPATLAQAKMRNRKKLVQPTLKRPAVDPRIWIKIFERTGLDQVLERSVKPLLGPLQMGMAPTFSSNAVLDPLEDDDEDSSLQGTHAAFRAYLTLILVNTEPEDQPTSLSEHSTITLGHRLATSASISGGSHGVQVSDLDALTVENLFLHGILASFRKANPTKAYRTAVLGWIKILVAPVISFEFIRDQLRELGTLNVTMLQTHQSDSQEQGQTRQLFQGIFGMGRVTIKYLPTLVDHICHILEFPLPSSPASVREESLKLACAASDALRAVMEVSRARIPRYRGKIMAAIASCWANSRIFVANAKHSPDQKRASQEQALLDRSLVHAMRLCTELCQPRGTGADGKAGMGLKMDLEVLRELDTSIFDPLFAFET